MSDRKSASFIPVLSTPRLKLRGPQAADFSAYREFFADTEGSRPYGGPLDAAQAWRKLAFDIGHWQLRGYGVWTLLTREGARVAGSCGLVWPEGWPRAELTWWITPAMRRQGYALEASRAAIRFGYDVLGWPTVETHMNDGNCAARALAEILGGSVVARRQFPDGLTRNVYALPREIPI